MTQDGKLSAHYEHTVAVTAKGPWILSSLDGRQQVLAVALDRDLRRLRYAAIDQTWIGWIYRALHEDAEACGSWRDAEQFYKRDGDDASAAELRDEMTKAGCPT